MENQYNKLTYEEIEALVLEIDKGMKTMNGDTAPITLTARQAAILIWTYGATTRPAPKDDVFGQLMCMLNETPDEPSFFNL